MNQLSTIAEALKASLVAGKVANAFTPAPDTIERVYIPRYGEGETAAKVFVVMPEEKPELFGPAATRAQCEHDYTIRVALMKRIAAGDATSTAAVDELDALSDLREQLLDWIKGHRLQGNATLSDAINSPTYDPALLDDDGVYLTQYTLSYRFVR